jgi:hypothetical protein
MGVAGGDDDAGPDTGQPADRREHHRLGEELTTDLAAGRAERPPQADLALPYVEPFPGVLSDSG